MLTQEELKQQLNYEPNTGDFIWIKHKSGVTVGQKGGWSSKDGYRRIELNKKQYQAHRLAWLYVYGYFPKNQIDHINRIKSDNRIANLRDVDSGTNQRNSKRLDNPYHGVRLDGKTWRVQLILYGQDCCFGRYSTRNEARIVAQKVKERLGLWKIPEEIKNDNVKL